MKRASIHLVAFHGLLQSVGRCVGQMLIVSEYQLILKVYFNQALVARK